MASAAHGATFDAFADFSATLNPNGVWSYGQLTGASGGIFSPLKAGSCGPLTGWNNTGTADPSGSPPFIFKGTGTCGTGTPPSGQLDLHPGPSGVFPDVRWTSPSAGTVAFSGLFQGIDPVGPTTSEGIVLLNNTAFLFDQLINTFGVPVSFSFSLPVAAGTTLDFIVGIGPDASNAFDSTGFNAHISFQPPVGVPDSGSLVLLGSGLLGLAGFTWRRHRRK